MTEETSNASPSDDDKIIRKLQTGYATAEEEPWECLRRKYGTDTYDVLRAMIPKPGPPYHSNKNPFEQNND